MALLLPLLHFITVVVVVAVVVVVVITIAAAKQQLNFEFLTLRWFETNSPSGVLFCPPGQLILAVSVSTCSLNSPTTCRVRSPADFRFRTLYTASTRSPLLLNFTSPVSPSDKVVLISALWITEDRRHVK